MRRWVAVVGLEKRGTLAEQIARIFPQFCRGKHPLFTFEGWGKRERYTRKALDY
jgi:hypothetical protein